MHFVCLYCICLLEINFSSSSTTACSFVARDKMGNGSDLNGDNLRICGSLVKVGLGLGLRMYETNCWRK